MSEEIRNTKDARSFTVVTVPTDKTHAVIDFLASLENDEADVSGYMLSRGSIGGPSIGTAKLGWSGSGCIQTGINGSDINCLDQDQ
jgi:hypothetical protein